MAVRGCAAPRIDANLADSARQKAARFTELWIVESRPGENRAEKIELMILDDEANRYLDVFCRDSEREQLNTSLTGKPIYAIILTSDRTKYLALNTILGIRREDENPWERRVPLIPVHARELIRDLGIEIWFHRPDLFRLHPQAQRLQGKKPEKGRCLSRRARPCRAESPRYFLQGKADKAVINA